MGKVSRRYTPGFRIATFGTKESVEALSGRVLERHVDCREAYMIAC